jgi:putative transposase
MWHQTAIRLRERYSKIGIGRLCNLFGKTRHAFYDRIWHTQERYDQEQIVLEMLRELQRDMPGAGIPTLYKLLKQPLSSHGIKMGRDAIQELRRQYGLIQRPRRRYIATTDSYHRFKKYPNIIKDLVVTKPSILWVSDITYIRVGNDFNFLSLITDAYSRKIVGYCLYPTLAKAGPLTALRMAIQTLDGPPENLIHHSDRGMQYCCDEYINELETYTIGISMTENGDPYENALAERINGILKETFGLKETFTSTSEAAEITARAIDFYNNVRPHTGIDNLTPDQAHQITGEIKRQWKKKVYSLTKNHK